jgi:short-subunit dehydrogenase
LLDYSSNRLRLTTNLKRKYGDWALVTGATSGIGAEIARQLAAQGINIVLVARKKKALKEHSDELKKLYKVETLTISADLSTSEGIEKVSEVEQDIDLLVLAAGYETNGAFEKANIEQELQVLELNVTSVLCLTHHFSKLMVERGRGGILLVSGLVAHMPAPYFSNYAGTKAYVLHMGTSLHGELKPKGVDVSVLSPGLTDTPMTRDAFVDWSKMPMPSTDPAAVAKAALDGLGKQLLIIPGLSNKLLAMTMKLTSPGIQSRVDELIIKRAISTDHI